MTIQYNPQQLNISFLFCWRGTIFPLVLSDPMFWLLMAVHVLILHRHGMLLEEDGVGLPPLDWEASTIALSLLTFFLVFYGNHCYQRYFELHGHCVSIGQAMGQWAHLIRVHFGSRSVAQRWNMMRPMLGAMHIHYAYLRCEKSADGQEKMGVAYDEWRAMRATNLFTRAEVEQLDVYKGNQSFLATSWALGEVKSAILRAERGPSSAESDSKQLTSHRNKDGAEEANLSFQGNLESMPQLTVYKAFDDAAKSFMSECIASMEMLLQPVPFPYFHVLKLLMLAALLILSYALVELVDAHRVLSLTIYSITLLIMIGLQQVAIGMSDPFGDDEVDFDLEAFVRSAYDNSVALLLDQRMPLGDTLHSELRNPLSRENPPITVAVTGAAGQISYSLLPSLASGSVFGTDQPVILKLLDIAPGQQILTGVVMEMEDMAYPLISGLVATDDPAVAFKGADYVVFLGAFPRREGMERKDVMAKNVGIFHAQGTALAAHAKKSVKCLVVGNPANTNAAILSAAAGGLPKTSITALTRLDHNRATSLAASKMGLPCDELEGVIIWGNHSSTQYPDVRHAKSSTSGARVMDFVDHAYLEGEFLSTIQKRGAAIIAARKLSSAASAAKAICDHLRDWALGSNGRAVSMGVYSDGTLYGAPSGVYYSMPVKCTGGGAYEVVQGLLIDDFSRGKMKATGDELAEELTLAQLLLSEGAMG